MSATNFDFGVNDAETVKLWSELVNRDAEHQQVWGPQMYSKDAPDAVRHPDASKTGGMIAVHTEFQQKAGDRVTIANVARIKDRGVHGDGLLRDTGGTLSTYTMDLYFENFAEQVRSKGKLAEQRSVLDFRANARAELASWQRRKIEGAVVLALWGLTAPNNGSTVLNRLNWNSSETQTFLNAIQTFDSTHILYGGNATSDATIDSGCVLTAQLLTKAETTAFEDLAIPLDPLTIDGEDCLLLFTSNRGAESLKYDDDWRGANQFFTKGTNPMLRRAIGRYGNIYVCTYPNTLNPSANVGRSILAGKDCLQMAMVEEPSWFEDYEDTRKRREVISIGGMMGITATNFNGTRRNSLAIDHYVRT